jgi:hypothetical protein
VPATKASGFLLSLLSPVWRAKLCGFIGGDARWQLALDGGEAGPFRQLVALGSGASVTVEGGVGGVVALGLMADRYQVEAVQGAVEEAAVGLLTVESCGEVLARVSGSGLGRVEGASRELALQAFDQFTSTAGFMKVGEEVLGSLLEDDGLCTEAEERVFEGVVRWMKGGEGGSVRGAGLLGKVRFPLMAGEYLAGLSLEGCGGQDGLKELAEEAVRLRRVWREERGKEPPPQHLGGKSAASRRGGVRWEECVGGGEQRLAADGRVFSAAVDGESVCGGLEDGTIRVWSR